MFTTLVTGGAGFIGSHLVETLLANGRRVVVIDDLSTGSLDNLIDHQKNPRLTVHIETIENQTLMRELIAEVDEVYHLAALVGVRKILEEPERTIAVNHDAAAFILHEAAERNKRLFLASTSEVYGKNPQMPLNENDDSVFGATTKGRWIYAYTKAMDEFLALALHRRTSFPVVIGRFFNTVGPRQSGRYGMVLPRFIDQALAGKPLQVHDDGRQIRCFCHVHDTVRAMVGLMAAPKAVGNVFNIGNDDPIEIRDLARHVVWFVNPGVPIENIPYSQAYGDEFEDIRRRVPDLSKIRSLIGYRPMRSLNDIIASILNWKHLVRRVDPPETPTGPRRRQQGVPTEFRATTR